MEKEDTNSSGVIELGGDNVVIPESKSTGTGSGDSNTSDSKPKDSKTTSIKEISKKAYINVIKRPFSLIAKIRKRDYWKLDKEEESDIGESYECVAKVIPSFFVKYFCFVNFGVSMFSIILRRLMEDKKIRDEEEGEEEIKEAQGNTEKAAFRSKNSTSEKGKGKIGKGARNG